MSFATEHLGSAVLPLLGAGFVYGGLEYEAPALVTTALLASLEALTQIDPLHMPLNLVTIHAIAAAHPNIPWCPILTLLFTGDALAARCFAFAARHPGCWRAPLRIPWLSFEFVAGRLARLESRLAQKKVINAHLDSGASLCALNAGVSVATTMGFTTLDGHICRRAAGASMPALYYTLRLSPDRGCEAMSATGPEPKCGLTKPPRRP